MRKKKFHKIIIGNKWFFLLLIMIGCVNGLFSIDLDFSGFVDTYHTMRIKSPNDFLISRTRLRLEMTARTGNSLAFVSLEQTHHNTLPSQTGLVLREAYLEYDAPAWDIRVGRQIIVWGKADGVQITDIISPLDLREFLARDYDDMRLPVDALKFRLLGSKTNFEFIWVPFFREALLPSGENPWAPPVNYGENVNVIVDEPIRPEKKIANSELFTKISFFLHGVDLAFSAFSTWDAMGIHHVSMILHDGFPALELQQEYYRVNGLGVEFSKPVGKIVVRGEATIMQNKRLETLEGPIPGVIKKNKINALLGIDLYPGNDWIITAQFIDEIILDYENSITDDRHTWLATLYLEKKLLDQTLTFSDTLYMGINKINYFNRFKLEYALTEALHIMVGTDLFGGDSSGLFGQMKENKEVFMKVKYSF